jgi:hypothetical protein
MKCKRAELFSGNEPAYHSTGSVAIDACPVIMWPVAAKPLSVLIFWGIITRPKNFFKLMVIFAVSNLI